MGAAGMEVAYRSHSRVNGWSWPLHPFQFIAWLFLIFFGLMYFLVIVPALLNVWQPLAYASVGVLFLIHFVAHLICVSINPADAAVLAKMTGIEGKVQIPTLDRSKHKHAIEDQHCYLCEVDVGATSKHCSACNKCIGKFDHHCKWLNNCVGSRNYKLFLSTLVSALLGCLIILILSILLFTTYYTDKESGNFLKPYKDFHNQYSNHANSSGSFQDINVTTFSPLLTSANPINNSSIVFKAFHFEVLDEIWLFLVGLTGVLALVAIGLLGHLYGFHVYLMCYGMTTYDYIVMQREKEEKAAREREWREKDGSENRCRNTKANQVAPQTKLESARSLGQHSGGVLSEHDRVLSESNRHHGEEEMAPAPTPPPPMVLLTPRNKSKRRKERERDQLRSRSDNTLEGYESKRKKRKKKPHSPSEGTIFTTHSSGETINLMNGRPNGRVNGHISYMEADSLAKATLPPLHRNAFSSSSSLADNDDTQDLQAAIDEAKRLRDLEEGAAPAGGGSKHTPLPPPGVPGTYNPVSSGHFEVAAAPRLILPIPPPPVLPSGPAGEYHSDSAESLQEVPLSSGRSMKSMSSSRLPPLNGDYRSDYRNSNSNSNRISSRSGDYGSSHRNGDHTSRSDRQRSSRSSKSSKSTLRSPPSTEDFSQGSVNLSSLRGLPVTNIGGDTPRNSVPPLDLTSLNGDENDRKRSNRKKKRHKQVSKI